MRRWREVADQPHHCEPTGLANARRMINSANQSMPLNRLCERSEAIHLSLLDDMDCFAALAMTAEVGNDG